LGFGGFDTRYLFLQVAEVDVAAGKITAEIFGQERPVAFGADCLTHGDGLLSEEIMSQGIETLRDFMGIANDLGCTSFSAVATEVFRKAKNGEDYLRRVREDLSIPVEVVTQASEGQLGYKSACAYSDQDGSSVVSWDSGGASFQIVSAFAAGDDLRYFMGALGTSITTAHLVEQIRGLDLVQGRKQINPVSAAEAEELTGLLRSRLDAVPNWLLPPDRPTSILSAIGGANSIFHLACTVRGEGHDKVLRAAEIHQALAECVGKSDEELAVHLTHEHADPPSVVVAKLCLLKAVVDHLKWDEVKYHPCVGSCAGLLVSEEYWRDS